MFFPIGKRSPSLEQSWISFTQGYMYFVPTLKEIYPVVEIDPVVLEMTLKMWKKFIVGQTDRQKRTTGDQKSSLASSAIVS